MKDVKIFVVEDQMETAFWLQSQLEAFGYQVPCTTSSGEQAIQRVDELLQKPDLILMDINFDAPSLDGEQKLDGIDAARLIHEKYDIPIIYLTGSTDTDTINRATKSGAYAFLVKPINPAELKTTIELTISKNRQLEEDRKKELERAKCFIEGQDRERIRFSEELHEEIGTVLSVLSTELSFIETIDYSNAETQKIIPKINKIRSELNSVIHSIRILSSELAPTTLINLGLKKGIVNYLKMLTAKNPSIRLNVRLDDLDFIQDRLDLTFQLSLYRIIVELINNVYQHSNAKNATIECIVTGSSFDLIIEDDGIGFNLKETENKEGIGYLSITSRVNVLNGLLLVESEANSSKGTYINMHFPLTNHDLLI